MIHGLVGWFEENLNKEVLKNLEFYIETNDDDYFLEWILEDTAANYEYEKTIQVNDKYVFIYRHNFELSGNDSRSRHPEHIDIYEYIIYEDENGEEQIDSFYEKELFDYEELINKI